VSSAHRRHTCLSLYEEGTPGNCAGTIACLVTRCWVEMAAGARLARGVCRTLVCGLLAGEVDRDVAAQISGARAQRTLGAVGIRSAIGGHTLTSELCATQAELVVSAIAVLPTTVGAQQLVALRHAVSVGLAAMAILIRVAAAIDGRLGAACRVAVGARSQQVGPALQRLLSMQEALATPSHTRARVTQISLCSALRKADRERGVVLPCARPVVLIGTTQRSGDRRQQREPEAIGAQGTLGHERFLAGFIPP
jgi:hypothetical protein